MQVQFYSIMVTDQKGGECVLQWDPRFPLPRPGDLLSCAWSTGRCDLTVTSVRYEHRQEMVRPNQWTVRTDVFVRVT